MYEKVVVDQVASPAANLTLRLLSQVRHPFPGLTVAHVGAPLARKDNALAEHQTVITPTPGHNLCLLAAA
jgi:hypothetical protein